MGRCSKRQRDDDTGDGTGSSASLQSGNAPAAVHGDDSIVRRSSRARGHMHRFVAGPAGGGSHIFESAKFHFVPANGWHRFVWKMGCSALNTIKWKGERPLPTAPRACWLLPATDEMAIVIARLQSQLLAAGWKLLTCDERVVAQLSNKASLRDYAEKIGMLKQLPLHFASPEVAKYPCMLKAAVGEHGRNVYRVSNAEDVFTWAPNGLGSDWLLQEIIPGAVEYSASLLVRDGRILDSICTAYEYEKEEYVWPHVREISRKYAEVPACQLATMRLFLKEYSGICNFNFKLRAGGHMGIFEINTRVGADLACDVPRPRARALFEKLNSLY
mmetsp:Transcript_69033/g.114743  ORF Transcript_69033/g.114743 Transcript_69033/m.114743 type:complete len:330 (-) Transcript_69033:392-1381(-)